MELYAQLGNTVLVAVVGILICFYARGRFDHAEKLRDELKADMNRRFDEMNARFDDVKADFREVRTELKEIRSDLTYVALAVGARPRPEANQA